MSFNFNDYPATSFYDDDLGYLVKAYKKLVQEYEKIQKDYDEILDRYKQMQKDIEDFPREMQRLYNDALEKFQSSFDDFSKQTIERLLEFNTEILRFEQETIDNITTLDEKYMKQLRDMREDMSAFEYRMELAWSNYRDSVNRTVSEMKRDMQISINASQNYVKLYADGKVAESEKRLIAIIDQWTKDFPPVINPINGMTEPLNDVLRQIWEVHVDGITVNQLVDSRISVSDIVDMRLSVLDIVTKGYSLLYWKKPWKMYSPFTGQYTNVTDVIYQLAALHKLGITTQVLAGYSLAVQKIVDASISAYNVSWNGGVEFAKLAESV